MGDLPGVRSRLPYLRRLGVDAVWLTPFYPSPQVDGGYDVADYRGVEPLFGSLADLEGIVHDAHELGLRVIVDIVPNHTSSAHDWFQAALAAPAGSKDRARYLFRKGAGPDGAVPPNDWQSNFGGPAWTRVIEADGEAGEWYLHLFDAAQPDLDWTNTDVVEEFQDVLRFWLDRGVDGFRIDVAHGLAKDQEMPDLGEQFVAGGPAPFGHPHWDRDAVHDVYRGWRSVADEYEGDRAFVGEIWLDEVDRVAQYLRPDELHTAFNFHFLLAPWEAGALREAIDVSIGALRDVGAPATWVLSNHDVIRHVTRYGGGELGTRRARAAALLMLALPGGAYIYQGEELGLPEVGDLPDELRQDPTYRRTGGERLGRDGCRVPIPWTPDGPSLGFGDGAPWLPQPPEWAGLSVATEEDDRGSTLRLYRDALAIRRRHDALGDGEMSWLDSDGDVLVFRRDRRFGCVVNAGAAAVPMPDALKGAAVLLASAPLDDDGSIPSDTTVWFESGASASANPHDS
ncbi:MAG: glycoside hydrolase family 13 protein [Acidimicrobiia bacterium]|nr:glycoside hydrolase family 13 protein [Acidimicrobiia bacterium]